uniref:hypothetical protein n=1 Tax=Raoultella terrigena TaxID=577 RepID=UPI001C700A42
GYEVSCCPDAGQIGGYAREVRPQLMFGVPRVWEKIHSRVTAALEALLGRAVEVERRGSLSELGEGKPRRYVSRA